MTRVLALCGSLRRRSLNGRLLAACRGLAPGGWEWDHWEGLSSLPLFDEDLEKTPAPAVRRLRTAIGRADALVIVTPEYNHSLPGGLKNALDWASRPHGAAALTGKPVALLVATVSLVHGDKALQDGARVLTHMGNRVVLRPGVLVRQAHHVLAPAADGAEHIVWPPTREMIRRQLAELSRCVPAPVTSPHSPSPEKATTTPRRNHVVP